MGVTILKDQAPAILWETSPQNHIHHILGRNIHKNVPGKPGGSDFECRLTSGNE